jgi:hypothetical protein
VPGPFRSPHPQFPADPFRYHLLPEFLDLVCTISLDALRSIKRILQTPDPYEADPSLVMKGEIEPGTRIHDQPGNNKPPRSRSPLCFRNCHKRPEPPGHRGSLLTAIPPGIRGRIFREPDMYSTICPTAVRRGVISCTPWPFFVPAG